jgi:hypothetical protein
VAAVDTEHMLEMPAAKDEDAVKAVGAEMRTRRPA